ncbi:hypothetical protein SORBI_3003G188600 [Sorghum bicolor]|uniref:Uncharacterized protein n=1 Tax=Sorghum bicolor TaxID=4558 RepID=A0A1W0VY16_SORBI|nr:hypothetical protein SORBI_3003G188600 [Sorghum bicolor]
MEIIGFVTPIGPLSEENHKSDENLVPLECEGTMECNAQDNDAVGLDARVEGVVFYDVELTVLGNYTGHGLPLDFLESKTTGEPIKGYPVDVDVLEDCSSASIHDHLPVIRRIGKKRLRRGHDGRWMKRTPLRFPAVSTAVRAVSTAAQTKKNSNEDPVFEECSLLLTLAAKASLLHT